MKSILKNINSVLLLAFISSSVALSSEIKEERFNFKASKRQPLSVRLEIDAGRVKILPGSDDREIELRFKYEEKRYEVSVEFDEDENSLNAYFDIKKWFKDEDEEDEKSTARMTVELPTDVPIEIYCKTKAGETEIELGDLRVRDLTLRVLAGETFLAFSHPNRERIKELKIESKVGELIVEKLGNANFEYAEIDGNIGELSVDFESDMEAKFDRDIDMSLNIGQTRLYFPRDEAIRFKVSKFLFFSDLDIPRYFYKEGKYYYSDNYDNKKYKTQLSISPGVGTLDIRIR